MSTRNHAAEKRWADKYKAQGAAVPFSMAFDPADPFDERFQSRTFAPLLTLAMRQILTPGDICVDVGAQKGYVTLHAAALVGSAGRVLSFEPDQRAADLLVANCAANDFRNVSIFRFAAGKTSETRLFKLSAQLGWSSFYPNDRNAHAICGAATVRVFPLDKVLLQELETDDFAQLKFIKIDCEGSELEVLRGLHTVLDFAAPVMWIEINTDSLRVAGTNELAVLSELDKLKYTTFLCSIQADKEKVPFLLCEPYHGNATDRSHRVFDILAIPRSCTRLPAGMLLR